MLQWITSIREDSSRTRSHRMNFWSSYTSAVIAFRKHLSLSDIEVMSVHMRMELWLHAWEAKNATKDLLIHLPFNGRYLFSFALDTLICDITGGRTVLLKRCRSVDRTEEPQPQYTMGASTTATTESKSCIGCPYTCRFSHELLYFCLSSMLPLHCASFGLTSSSLPCKKTFLTQTDGRTILKSKSKIESSYYIVRI